MDNLRNLFLLPWLTAAIVAFASTPLVIKFARNLGIMDDPKRNKHPKVIHTYPTPRGGGIPIFLALLVSIFIFLPIDKHAVGILIGAAILVVMGTLDDRLNLNPYLRLALGFLAALISGYLALLWLRRLVSRGQLNGFAYYCLILGFLLLFF